MRVGQGFDVHQLVLNRSLILGGITIPYEFGLLGHSDADVLIHAIMDALLGAIGAGDIGRHFPDTDPRFQDADSMALLRTVLGMVWEAGYQVENVDATIIAQKPKLAGYIPLMQQNLCEAIGDHHKTKVNIKATTTENLGFTGRGEGIASLAIVLLTEKNLPYEDFRRVESDRSNPSVKKQINIR